METETSPFAVGSRLRALREARGFKSQSAFATALGVSQSKLSNWEGQGILIPPGEALKVCAYTGATMDYIYRGLIGTLPVDLAKQIIGTDPKQASA